MLKAIGKLVYVSIQLLGAFIVVTIALGMYNSSSNRKPSNDQNIENYKRIIDEHQNIIGRPARVIYYSVPGCKSAEDLSTHRYPERISCSRSSAQDGTDATTFLLAFTELYIKTRHLPETELDPDHDWEGPIQSKLAACLDKLATDPKNSDMLMKDAAIHCANDLDINPPHSRPRASSH